MDLVVGNVGYFAPGGNFKSQLALFENIGSDSVPQFNLIDRDYVGLSQSGLGQALHPTFGDVDGDGDEDLIVGDLQGMLHYYENNPSGGVASFSLTTPQLTEIGGTIIDIGQFATPQLFDVDDDGVLDMLIGERNGNINFYRNAGTANNPLWSFTNDSIGDVVVAEFWNITGHSVPFMFLNALGERELLVGSESGGIFLYDDIENNLGGTWNKVDSTFQGISDGKRTGVCTFDFNNDGLLDVIVGNLRGGLSFWKNDVVSSVSEIPVSSEVQLIPNPTTGAFWVNLPIESNDMRISAFDMLGNLMIEKGVNNSADLRIDAQNWPAGTYIVNVRGSNALYHGRVILLH